MKTLLILLFLFSNAVLAERQPATVVRVIDGDTIKISAPWVPAPLKPEISIRVSGVDTPEHAGIAQCDLEAQRADKATEFTQGLITHAKKIEVTYTQWDKYGGRILGEVWVDDKALSEQLIAAHLARAYHGEKKQGWCHGQD